MTYQDFQNKSSGVPAVLLAAGLSSRMGAFKPLLKLGDRALIQHAIESLQASGAISDILVITGHKRELLEEALGDTQGIRLLFNENYAAGEMLSSLKVGVQSLPPDAPGFLLAFADQPAVQPATIRALITELSSANRPSLVLPTHLGKKGHPVVLSSSLIPAIHAIPPGGTLRDVVHQHLSSAALVAVADPSIHDDLDTPQDFARAEARLRQH
jgi:CTP:molybdopterin cytidylyltransferase MocA